MIVLVYRFGNRRAYRLPLTGGSSPVKEVRVSKEANFYLYPVLALEIAGDAVERHSSGGSGRDSEWLELTSKRRLENWSKDIVGFNIKYELEDQKIGAQIRG